MRRADRLFDIIQILRTASHPITAAALAEKLEVTVRTIYRDIAALQGSRVSIEGAPTAGQSTRVGSAFRYRSWIRARSSWPPSCGAALGTKRCALPGAPRPGSSRMKAAWV